MKQPKNLKGLTKSARDKRVGYMLAKRDEYLEDVSDLHVCISNGNTKMGDVKSVSLIPIVDCHNCITCETMCYDIRSDCRQPVVMDSRARNSAILIADRDKYFREISAACVTLRYFRWHVGGDIVDYDYFNRMVDIAKSNSKCEFLVFTKCFTFVNRYIKYNGNVPSNLHIIFSNWLGLNMQNDYNFPTSNPLFANGVTTAKDGAKWCGGNCTECARTGEGCWTMDNGDEVIFPIH